jgi:hypothetical protein
MFQGCARFDSKSSFTPQTDRDTACLSQFAELDALTAATGTRYSAAWPIAGLPFLRTDRFLAALGVAPSSRAWVEALAAMDAQARAIELSNLAGLTRHALPNLAEVNECRAHLVAQLLADPELRIVAEVPDEYRLWQRVLGVYPLMRRLALRGIARLHDEHPVAASATPRGLRYRYQSAVPGQTAPREWLVRARDTLDRPRLTAPELEILFAAHAPAWQVAQRTAADLIGTPQWRAGEVTVDSTRAQVFTYTSHTLFEGRVLLQLNYATWFAARPAVGAFDWLAGSLDGLTWRVTLDLDGMPLIYDVMHHCGCYHQWFPTSRLTARAPLNSSDEPLWIPFAIDAESLIPKLTIHLAQDTHYVTAVTHDSDTGAGLPLAARPFDDLYSLPLTATRRRSIFGDDGIIHSSARGERFLLWPLGVPAPGAMRDRGHHATAFVGRRHFDDPALIERYFQREGG